MDWIFDLDGTLYTSIDHVWARTMESFIRYVVEEHSIHMDGGLIEQHRVKTKWQTEQTLVAYILEFGLDFDTVVETALLPIVDSLSITLRPGVETIHRLPGKKWILTNSPESFAHALLKKLGIGHLFDGVYGIRADVLIAKPHQESYRRIQVGTNVCFIDDVHTNLILPAEVGWQTVWFPEIHHEKVTPHYVHRTIRSFAELLEKR